MASDEDNSVSVSIRKIKNGYVFHRSWTEGDGEKRKYHEEDFFLAKLPAELEGLMEKGSMNGNPSKFWSGLEDEKLDEESESAETSEDDEG